MSLDVRILHRELRSTGISLGPDKRAIEKGDGQKTREDRHTLGYWTPLRMDIELEALVVPADVLACALDVPPCRIHMQESFWLTTPTEVYLGSKGNCPSLQTTF